MVIITDRYSLAFQKAVSWHSGQVRKGTSIPYISHPMAVSSFVLEFGGDEDQAIAVLLHDVIEDCGVKEDEINSLFGKRVSSIVLECTDAEAIPKPPWRDRKEKYITHLRHVSADTLLVSASDKLHNALAINNDFNTHGSSVWKRFSAQPKEILWYYQSLLRVFEDRIPECSPLYKNLVGRLSAAVSVMARNI